jgi:hypothetical protein
MQNYYYIPKQHEIALLDAIGDWSPSQSDESVICGVHLSEGKVYWNTIIYSINRDNEVSLLPYNPDVFSVFSINPIELLAYTLQSDLSLYEPSFKSILMSLEGVLEFVEVEDYQNHLNTLNQL